MAIIKYEPFRGFEGLSRQMRDFMNVFDRGYDINFNRGNFMPKVDISEEEKYINVTAEIPGLGKDNIKVSVNDDNVLVIKGEKKEENKEENNDKTIIRMERTHGSFTRSFVLPENINRDSINAQYKDGILELKIEKLEPEKPKELEISIN